MKKALAMLALCAVVALASTPEAALAASGHDGNATKPVAISSEAPEQPMQMIAGRGGNGGGPGSGMGGPGSGMGGPGSGDCDGTGPGGGMGDGTGGGFGNGKGGYGPGDGTGTGVGPADGTGNGPATNHLI